MLKVRRLCVRYSGFEALQEVDLDVQAGQWLMVAGPNGAGKSTLIRAIAQTVPYAGSVSVLGEDTRRMNSKELARRMAVLHQQRSLAYAFSVEELVSLGRYAHRGAFSPGDPEGGGKVEDAIRICGLSGFRRQNVLTLSGGELQRAFLAQVFAQDAPLLLLDEPASHLDLSFQREIFSLIGEWIKQPGRAVLCVVHDLQLALRFGTHAMLLDAGRREELGEAKEALSSANLRRVYHMDVPAWFGWLHQPWARMDRVGENGYNHAENGEV